MEQTVCFTGHRDISDAEYEPLKARLESELERLIARGVVHFRTGGARGFDTLAALCVLSMQQKHPHIRLHLILPCPSQTEHWHKNDVLLYQQICAKAHSVRYVSRTYFNGVLQMRNRALVEGADICLAYLRTSAGGTAYTASHAIRAGLEFINIAE